ncbi:MAG: AhpC/TSA family protein [Bacteroidales bacterium]|nr:AhpC/TSA family protein [Bacteroidales bacterium]
MIKSKLFYLFLLLILILQSCNSKVDNIEEYTISASIEGIDNGKAILVKLDLVTNEQVDVDSSEIINGKFIFKGKVESPYLHTIFINGKANKIHFFLENSDIEISADFNDLEHAKIIGSREDSLFRSYKTDDIFDREKGMEIMLKFPDYSFAAFTAYYQFQIYNIHVDTMDAIINNFKIPLKKTIYYKHLDKLYNILKRVAVSQPAPLFEIPDTEGNMVSLEDFKGKYILIDFWASWCAPCRESNPILVEVYNTFKKRNFMVIGISIDKDRDRWLKAIESDQLPWTNLSNLNGWDEVSTIYGVKAVPQNFLLDPDGIIIDKNIDPDVMIDKLSIILPRE